jgi:hypothetical protein
MQNCYYIRKEYNMHLYKLATAYLIYVKKGWSHEETMHEGVLLLINLLRALLCTAAMPDAMKAMPATLKFLN